MTERSDRITRSHPVTPFAALTSFPAAVSRSRLLFHHSEPECKTTHAVKIRGKLQDADSGRSILQSLTSTGQLEIDGVPLRRIEPGVEIHRELQVPSNASIPVRCGRCHALVPPERVLPDPATAQCTACGFVFAVPELERIPPPRQRRVAIEHHTDSQPGDTLRITQGGDFSLYPVFTFFATLSLVGVFLGLVWYVDQLYPAHGMTVLLSNFGKSKNSDDTIRLVILAGLPALMMLLPLWAFLERRTLTLDRETCRMEVRLLFFRWRRIIPRHEVLLAEYKPLFLEGMRYRCRLRYGRRKFFDFTFTFRRGADWLTGEINHYLYTVPGYPRMAAPSVSAGLTHRLRFGLSLEQPCYFGGMHAACDEVLPMCPHCGDALTQGDVFDLSQPESRCPRCGQTFAACRFVKVTGPASTLPVLEGLEFDETQNKLEIRYHHPMDMKAYWGNIAGLLVVVLMFLGMGCMCIFVMEDGKEIFAVVVALMCFCFPSWIVMLAMNDIRSCREWRWQITITPQQFELLLSWPNREKRVTIARADILAVDWNETNDTKSWWHTFYREKMPTALQNPMNYGWRLDLRDGARVYLPMVVTPQNPQGRSERQRILAAMMFKCKSS